MVWFWNLLIDDHSVASAILVLALTIVLGSMIGGVRILGIHLGVAGVLFSGLLVGHLGIHLQPEAAEFAREFGLVLFIYAVGMAVGPSFFNLFREYGLKTNSYAVGIVLLGTLLAWLSVQLGGIAPPIAVGILAGATTNTPSLAAASQTLDEFPPKAEAARRTLKQIGLDSSQMESKAIQRELGKLPGLGYALAYPSGVIGTILSFVILRRLFKIDPAADAQSMERNVVPPKPPFERRSIRLTRLEAAGKTADELTALSDGSAVVSRVRRDDKTFVAFGDTTLSINDVLLVVGTPDELATICRVAGEFVEFAEWGDSQEIVARWIVISQRNLVGFTIERSKIAERFHVRLTRVRRGDFELHSFADLRLAIGDSLFAVGSPEGIARLAQEAGDVARELEEPNLLPMFFGIALGVVVGSVPLAIPGLAAPLKVGLAGGPLIVALVLSHFRRLGPFVFYLPRPANTALKELGIAIFLAVVGIKSGSRFVETLTQGDGIWWLCWGVVITLVPLLVAGIVSMALFRASYTAVVGVLAGSMTDPPALAFANSLTKSEGASLTYATVYPTAMILRVVCAQVFLIASG